MGKYPNSKVHAMYSDFHLDLVKTDEKYRKLYQSDIDRLWIEYDFDGTGSIVGIIDVKWKDSMDKISPTENGIYNWFISQRIRVFIVFISESFEEFTVVRYGSGYKMDLNKLQYGDFLLSLRSESKYKEFFGREDIRVYI